MSNQQQQQQQQQLQQQQQQQRPGGLRCLPERIPPVAPQSNPTLPLPSDTSSQYLPHCRHLAEEGADAIQYQVVVAGPQFAVAQNHREGSRERGADRPAGMLPPMVELRPSCPHRDPQIHGALQTHGNRELQRVVVPLAALTASENGNQHPVQPPP